MNAQNPADPAARVTYYSLTGVPATQMDGGGPTWPYNWTQPIIDAEYAVPSPFTINLSHSFNTAVDSIFITAVITCTQNITMTTPKFRCAMVEDHIRFTNPPGSNGEKDFYDIVRKMYPNAAGTALATTWTVGQTQVITFAEKIPLYIYKKSQIAVVALIQDDANKNVKQAGYSAPLPVPTDAGVTLIAGINVMGCGTNFTPVITLKNFGANPLTDCDINY